MLQRDPNLRLSAQECLDHIILKTLQSDSIGMAEEHLKKTIQQSSASSSNSKVNEQEEQIPAHIDTEYMSGLAPGSFFDSSDSFDSLVSQYSPGVEEAVAWRDQGLNGSRTAMPPWWPQRSRSENPQPIPYGLVWAGIGGNGPENEQEVEVEEPTAKQHQRSEAGAIASSKGKGPENQHEVEVEEPTAKQHQRSEAGAIASSKGKGPENQHEVEVEEPTAKQHQRSEAGAIASSKGKGPENQHEVEVEEPTAKQHQRSEAGAIASSKGKGPENQHEVEVEEPTAKQYQMPKAVAIARPRRNLQPNKLPAFSPSGLSVAGPHRTPSQNKRNGSLISKRSTSSSVARHRRGSSTSESVTGTAAAHALMELKKYTR